MGARLRSAGQWSKLKGGFAGLAEHGISRLVVPHIGVATQAHRHDCFASQRFRRIARCPFGRQATALLE